MGKIRKRLILNNAVPNFKIHRKMRLQLCFQHTQIRAKKKVTKQELDDDCFSQLVYPFYGNEEQTHVKRTRDTKRKYFKTL